MSPKSAAYTAVIALVVVVAYEHHKAGGISLKRGA